MQKYLIKNITVVNEGSSQVADVLILDRRIEKIGSVSNLSTQIIEINGEGKHLLPGIIDDQVHFREPGLTHKGTIYTESKAAVAGGVTSFMEMPNTVPPVFTQDLLEEKYQIASQTSLGNYSFYMGTSNDNAEEALKTNDQKRQVCGIKIFMGSSTGGLLVNNYLILDKLFRESEVLIATHCEDEKIIRANLERIRKEKNELQPSDHPRIRDEEACYHSSLTAIQFAKKYNSRLHILHISTEKELRLFTNMLPLEQKKITAEVCVHHLHFTSNDYKDLGYQIKCNPAIKQPLNKQALWSALLDDRLDIIATDHAPHTLEEKGLTRDENGMITPFSSEVGKALYENVHAGLPLVQHSLLLMLHYVKAGMISLEKVVDKMSHAVAKCFQMSERGFIREGYFADLVIVDMNQSSTVSRENIFHKCGWSPFEDCPPDRPAFQFPATVTHTFVNGHLAYVNGVWDESQKGQRLLFER